MIGGMLSHKAAAQRNAFISVNWTYFARWYRSMARTRTRALLMTSDAPPDPGPDDVSEYVQLQRVAIGKHYHTYSPEEVRFFLWRCAICCCAVIVAPCPMGCLSFSVEYRSCRNPWGQWQRAGPLTPPLKGGVEGNPGAANPKGPPPPQRLSIQ